MDVWIPRGLCMRQPSVVLPVGVWQGWPKLCPLRSAVGRWCGQLSDLLFHLILLTIVEALTGCNAPRPSCPAQFMQCVPVFCACNPLLRRTSLYLSGWTCTGQPLGLTPS
jgi:hypothetical protein